TLISEGKNFGKEQLLIFEKLNELERLAKRSSNHAYLCYNVYSTLAWYWQNVGGKPEKMMQYIQLSLPFASKLEGFVFNDFALEAQLKLADGHFILGGAQEAYEIFERTFSSVRPDHMIWKRNYYLFRYIAILIYNEKYT